MSDWAEMIAAGVAVVMLIGLMAKAWMQIASELVNHDIRIAQGELILQNTAKILARTSNQLAMLEERTKDL